MASCKCRACGKQFSGEADFDSHRTGKYLDRRGLNEMPYGRRCLREDEMRKKGMEMTDTGKWRKIRPQMFVYFGA